MLFSQQLDKCYFKPSTNNASLFIVIQLINLLTLASQWSLWLWGIIACSFLYQGYLVKIVHKPPSRVVKLSIAIVGCFLIVINGFSLGLLSSMLHLLALAYALKPLELKLMKDHYQLVILSILLLACSFIFHQSIYFAGLILVLVMMNFAWLRYLHFQVCNQITQLKVSAKLVMYSIPLTMVLFIGFPKIPPFWQMPQVNVGKTGLSDKLSIGDVSQLALSNALAFRVEFSGLVPNYQEMYWRVMTLEHFDGRSWSRQGADNPQGNQWPFANDKRIVFDDSHRYVDYQVIAEPSYQQWLFTLDLGQINSANNQTIYSLKDYSLVSKNKLIKPFAYSLVSDLDASLNLYYHPRRLEQNLLSVAASNPKLTQYGQQLAVQYDDPQKIVDVVLAEFSSNNFSYTLSPPAIINGSLDQFFFDTQAGFCEYYASSFTYIMRAAGIPARIVLGYLGGKYNQQGNYYAVFQRDAHAWSEVWIEGAGWVRIDPTASVDPSRVENGFSSTLMNEQQNLAEFQLSHLLSGPWINYLELYLDAIDYQWTKQVINYSIKSQQQLLKAWLTKYSSLKNILKLLISVALFIILVFAVVWYKRWRKRTSHLPLRLYQAASKLLVKKGFKKSNSMSQNEFVALLAINDAALSHASQRFYQCYNEMIYGSTNSGLQTERSHTQLQKQYKSELKIRYKKLVSIANKLPSTV